MAAALALSAALPGSWERWLCLWTARLAGCACPEEARELEALAASSRFAWVPEQ